MNKLCYFSSIIMLSSIVCCACARISAEEKMVIEPLQEKVIERTAADIEAKPATVTCFIAERSAGTKHDFYSEGDYWWPDSLNPTGPYVRRDGETNPDNFVEHRHAMIRFSRIVANLTSAYLITGDRKYLDPVMAHVRAWFINEDTKMNPHLLYAQAIKGITTGRGIGIIDTVHLIEVAQSLMKLEEKNAISRKDLEGAKEWFRQYLTWMKTHPYGVSEMNATNNHGTCWAMQAAMFAKLIGDKETMDFCSDRFKNVFIPNQMAEDGSFPQELNRTKPYGYSLFNLDAMAALCQILSTEDNNLWEYTTPDGRNMKKAVEFMLPYIADKSTWEYGKDVMYWDEWPVAHPALLFAWMNFGDEEYYNNWAKFEHFPENEEVIRNLPIRNPIIWL